MPTSSCPTRPAPAPEYHAALRSKPTATTCPALTGLRYAGELPAAEAATMQVFQVAAAPAAPRQWAGSRLVGQPLPGGAVLTCGELLAWREPGAGDTCFRLARLVGQSPGVLHLASGGHALRLAWSEADPARPVYRITHYLNLPVA